MAKRVILIVAVLELTIVPEFLWAMTAGF